MKYMKICIFSLPRPLDRKKRREDYRNKLSDRTGKSSKKQNADMDILNQLSNLGPDRFSCIRRRRDGWSPTDLDIISNNSLNHHKVDDLSTIDRKTLLDIRKDCLRQAKDSLGLKEIWDSLRRALWRGEERRMMLCGLQWPRSKSLHCPS